MKRKTLVAKGALSLLSATLIFGLAACGGGDDADPLQKYREQTVQWGECDPTMMGAPLTPAFAPAIEKYGERLKCGFVRAPLDWANPERGEVVISATRLAAGKSSARRGALLFNPGGPGGDGFFTLTLWLLEAFAESNPDSPQGAMQLRLLDEYDMVGFSPRGTGTSTRMQCATNEVGRIVDVGPAGWDTPENLANSIYNSSKIAQACLKSPVAPFINTDATARDMDLLRGLLGDEKLNYVGYSYGTWLGSWYASLFPDRVGRMVLDSSMDFNRTFEQSSTPLAPAQQRMFDKVLVPYAVRHADYFRLGSSEAEVRAVMPALSPRVQSTLVGPLGELTSSRTHSDTFLTLVASARGLDEVLRAAPNPADLVAVSERLGHYVFHPSDQERDAQLRRFAVQLLQRYSSLWVQPESRSIELSNKDAVFWTVQCNDTPASTDLTTWAYRMRDQMHQAPMFFGNHHLNICAFWGGPKVSKPDLAPMKQLDVMFVQSQYDAATDTEGATAFFSGLPKAGRVFVTGEYQHAVYPYKDHCVDPAVTRYLLGEPITQRELSCDSHPLARDKLATDSADAKSVTIPVYKNPQKAEELLREFKKGIRPGA